MSKSARHSWKAQCFKSWVQTCSRNHTHSLQRLQKFSLPALGQSEKIGESFIEETTQRTNSMRTKGLACRLASLDAGHLHLSMMDNCAYDIPYHCDYSMAPPTKPMFGKTKRLDFIGAHGKRDQTRVNLTPTPTPFDPFQLLPRINLTSLPFEVAPPSSRCHLQHWPRSPGLP